jgi:hypothetical protein
MTWRASLIAAFLIAANLAGCASDPRQGYSSATSLFPEGISTVAGPVFTNDSYTRDVEFELTDALIKELEVRTPYKVVPESRADTILVGQIRKIELDQLSKSQLTGLSEEVIVSVTIDFQWKDLRNGRVITGREAFTGHGLFDPSRPTDEPIELGQFAAVQQLARDIVAQMQAQW